MPTRLTGGTPQFSMSDDDLMPFGKHKGTPLDDLPSSYLRWLHRQKWLKKWPRVLAYIEENWSSIDEDVAFDLVYDDGESYGDRN